MAMAQFMGSLSMPTMDPTQVVFLDNNWFKAYTALPYNDPKYVHRIPSAASLAPFSIPTDGLVEYGATPSLFLYT